MHERGGVEVFWTKWVTIHESYGLPRAAQECRTYLENRGIRVKLRIGKSKRDAPIYVLQVPEEEKKEAEALLSRFKKTLN
jgi:hypothetical protein